MTRPEQIHALRDRLAEVGRAVDRFQATLPLTNERAHQDFFGGILRRIALIVANEREGVMRELASDLLTARQQLRRLRLPETDTDLDGRTPALDALRGERGNLVEALENALDAAREVGLTERGADAEPLMTPRQPWEAQLIRLDERVRGLEDFNAAMGAASRDADALRPNAAINQRGLVNLHVAAISVEVSALRFETQTGDGPGVPKELDLVSLARTGEAIRDIGLDVKATVEQLHDWLVPTVRVLGGLVARAAARSWRGVQTVVRLALRRLDDVPKPTPTTTDPPADFDLKKAVRMILTGQAPPALWRPFIIELNLSATSLTQLAPLAGLTSLRKLTVIGMQIRELAPLAGLISLQELNLGHARLTELGPIAGLTNLQTLTLDNTQVTELAPLARLTNLKSLDLDNTEVAELAPLAGLTSLQTLSLNKTHVVELAPLAGLTNLQKLSLNHTPVTELAPLAGLTSLQSLDLTHTRVRGLEPLAALTSLRWLDLANTPVGGLGPLSRLKNLHVSWNGKFHSVEGERIYSERDPTGSYFRRVRSQRTPTL